MNVVMRQAIVETPDDDFYSSGAGDALFKNSLFPAGIRTFLESEQSLFAQAARHKKAVIEIGCHQGTYAALCRSLGLRYIGIDPVERYIEAGRAQWRGHDSAEVDFVVGTAEEVDAIVERSLGELNRAEVLILVPFNCFGNIQAVERAAQALCRSGCHLMISSYQTTLQATSERFAYYLSCGYNPIIVDQNARGVLFSDNNGLHTYAYSQRWLCTLFATWGVTLNCHHHGSLGAVYLTEE